MVANHVDTQATEPWKDKSSGPQINTRTLIGQPPRNHWLHSDEPPAFDLTRPQAPDFPAPRPHEAVTIDTTTTPIIISPTKTALVIIDMQNFFLSTALGRQADGAGAKAKRQLLDLALPAARASGIQVIWLNWGLSQEDIDQMPASTLRGFGFRSDSTGHHGESNDLGKPRNLYQGLGHDMGPIKLEDGTTVEAGRMLMRDTWNADLPPDLKETYQDGLHENPPHIWIHKNRMSGLWGSSTPCTTFLEQHGIRTLLFAGVNTDQCVGGSLQDAYTKGFDCIMLKDVCGTTSPEFAQQCIEYNAARSWGFVTDCEAFKAGVDNMLEHKPN